MQYETIFDIDFAWPTNWSGGLIGLGIVIMFLLGRFRQEQLADPALQQRILDFLPRFVRPRFLWRWLQPLARIFVWAIIVFAVVLAPFWRWGVGLGLLIIALTLFQIGSSFREISRLQNAGHVETLQGTVDKIDTYVNKSGRREYLDVASRHFDYGEKDPGTPYTLRFNSRPVSQGQHVRLSLAGNRIVRVERQLCLIYPHCSVRYFLGIRFEAEKTDLDQR